MRKLLLAVLLLLYALTGMGQARRAFNLMEKGRYEEAREVLQRGIAKDSLDAAARLVLAQLFFTEEYPDYSIDSAYYYVLAARQTYDSLESKEQEKLDKAGLGQAAGQTLQRSIEKVAFARAKQQDSEEAYLAYIQQFSASPLLDSAILLRNRAAYRQAKATHTYQAYRSFLDKYPAADEAAEAQKWYELLLYQHLTADGKLASYRQFIREYPHNRHRLEAEKHVYDIVTGANTPEALQAFMKEVRHGPLYRQAALRLYSMLPPGRQDSLLKTGFFDQPLRDSIRHMHLLQQHLLVPAYQQGYYLLLDTAGHSRLRHLPALGQADKCGRQEAGLVLVPGQGVLALDSSVLTQEPVTGLSAQGLGLLRLKTAKGYFFITRSGWRDNPHYFSNAHLTGRYIAFRSDGGWGLESITGRALLAPHCDTLFAFHNLMAFRAMGRWAVVPQEALIPMLDNEPVSWPYEYDTLAAAGQYLLVGRYDSLGLLNSSGKLVVPLAPQLIEVDGAEYFVDRGDSIMDSSVAKRWYRDIYRNEDWLLAVKDSTTEVFYHGKRLLQAKEARTLGLSAALISLNDTLYCYFTDTARIRLQPDDIVVPVNRMDTNSLARHYVLTNAKTGKKTVFNRQGQTVEVGAFDKLIDLGATYILSRQRRGYHLLDDSGRVLLTRLEGAVSLGREYVAFVQKGLFGLYSQPDSVLIEPAYERPPRPYSDSVFVIARDGHYGLLSNRDTLLTPVIYKEIRYLNDSIAGLNHNFRWLFWHLGKGAVLLDNISDYQAYRVGDEVYFKVLKGVGYGIWSPGQGLVLNPTFTEITVWTKDRQVLFVAEKWVEEADLVILLYYNGTGKLVHKSILSTAEYQRLQCVASED
ncbi:MAG TPA: hypothetical protein ENJ39_03575 [Flammeovirgaceae bacterium]|nr:hypothetical protein [Flammeovirgaceae bacterium]